MCDHFDVPPIKNLQTIPKFFAREPPALFSCTVGIANIIFLKFSFHRPIWTGMKALTEHF